MIGLSTAIRLQDRGFDVTIVAREVSPHTTSDVAAAVWYPYLTGSDDRLLGWIWSTYRELVALTRQPGSGVTELDIVELFDDAGGRPWWSDATDLGRQVSVAVLPDGYGAGYRIRVPMADTSVYLPWLRQRFEARGGVLEQRPVHNLAEFSDQADVVVNCTGLGARDLCRDDEVYPVRGQVVRVAAVPSHAWVDEGRHLGYMFILPRADGCVLGGTAEPGEWSTEPDEQATADIIERCARVEPSLREAAVLSVRVGLRPGRSRVRLERDGQAARTVIHNYGHGGSGLTMSWGCADDAAQLALRYSKIQRSVSRE